MSNTLEAFTAHVERTGTVLKTKKYVLRLEEDDEGLGAVWVRVIAL